MNAALLAWLLSRDRQDMPLDLDVIYRVRWVLLPLMLVFVGLCLYSIYQSIDYIHRTDRFYACMAKHPDWDDPIRAQCRPLMEVR